MKKIIFILGLIVIVAANCKKDDDPVEEFDYAGQAVIDNDSLVDYMNTHYVDVNGELQEITSGETPVMDQVSTKKVKRKWILLSKDTLEVEYNLYYLILNQGVNNQPNLADSVHVSYKGILLDDTVFDQSDYGIWMGMPSVVLGFSRGLTELKSGNWTTATDGSFTFSETGKGIVLMPSGLGYGTQVGSKIPANSPLIFYLSLNLVKEADWDGDGILSIYEDLNHNGDFTDDDTDGDGYPNYVDSDDDGDGTLTKYENADPNGDHNPADAKDTDTDGTPDYLDKDTL